MHTPGVLGRPDRRPSPQPWLLLGLPPPSLTFVTAEKWAILQNLHCHGNQPAGQRSTASRQGFPWSRGETEKQFWKKILEEFLSITNTIHWTYYAYIQRQSQYTQLCLCHMLCCDPNPQLYYILMRSCLCTSINMSDECFDLLRHAG